MLPRRSIGHRLCLHWQKLLATPCNEHNDRIYDLYVSSDESIFDYRYIMAFAITGPRSSVTLFEVF